MHGENHGDYRLISLGCVSHQVNLVVQVAICGKVLAKPLLTDAICCACSRFTCHCLSALAFGRAPLVCPVCSASPQISLLSLVFNFWGCDPGSQC